MTLSGFGIYLGRFLRWNSWDLVTQPRGRGADLARIARDPVGTPLAVTGLFTVFVGITYLALYAVAEFRASPTRTT